MSEEYHHLLSQAHQLRQNIIKMDPSKMSLEDMMALSDALNRADNALRDYINARIKQMGLQ